MSQRLVLIGGSGFIGQNLIRYLEENNLREKYLTVIYDPSLPQFYQPDLYIPGKVEEREKIENVIKEQDIILYLAHTTLPIDSFAAPERELKENIKPVLKFLELMKEKAIKGMIYFSSGGTIYGEQKELKPIKEDAPKNPNSFYALGKLMIEESLKLFGRLNWLNYLIIRPSNPYGPFQEKLNRHGAVAKIFQSLLEDKEFIIYGQGETVRDYIFIDDLISGIIFLIEQNIWNNIFNIGTSIPTSLTKLIELCEKISNKSLKKIYKPIRQTDLKYNVLDISRLKNLGWEPKFSLEKGLKETWKYFLEAQK